MSIQDKTLRIVPTGAATIKKSYFVQKNMQISHNLLRGYVSTTYFLQMIIRK